MSYPPQTTGIGTPTNVLLNFAQVLSDNPVVALHVGDTYQISPTLIDSAGNILAPTSTFTYTSLNANIATVSAGGLMTANAIGNAQIRVSYGGQQATLSVSVLQPTAPTAQFCSPIRSTNYPSKWLMHTAYTPAI
jgi:hypothetical protein